MSLDLVWATENNQNKPQKKTFDDLSGGSSEYPSLAERASNVFLYQLGYSW